MSSSPGRLVAATFVMALASGAVQAKLDPATDRQVGGIFSNACADRSQVMVRLYEDVIDIERGSTAVKASKLKVAKTAPTGAATPDFKFAVSGQVKSGDEVNLVLTHNAQGLFARIDGSEKALAALGPGVIGQKLRHCDPNRNALPGAAPTKPELPEHPAELLKDARFKAAYLKALGPLAKTAWLAKMNGPASPVKKVQVGGAEFWMASPCKPHDCADNNLLLLWSPAGGTVAGKVVQGARNSYIGDPPPELQGALDRLWKAEFRR